MTNKKQITSKTKISKVLEEKGEKAAEILMNAGMHCVFCPMAQQETLQEGCLAHGMNEKDIQEIIKKLNEIK